MNKNPNERIIYLPGRTWPNIVYRPTITKKPIIVYRPKTTNTFFIVVLSKTLENNNVGEIYISITI